MGMASMGVLAVVLTGFMTAFGLSTEVTAVGVVGAVALHAMGKAFPDVLPFATAVGVLRTMSTRPIDMSTSSAQLNLGIFFTFPPLSSLFSSLSPFSTASSATCTLNTKFAAS
jgi:Na+/H+ antiporter NhaB